MGLILSRFRVALSAFCLAIVFIHAAELNACTSFVVKKGDRQYLAKNLDWYCGEGYAVFNSAGTYRVGFMGNSNQLNWKSKYHSVTFNQHGAGFPLGGMNERGLVIEELNSPANNNNDEADYLLNELQWIQYQLDNHSTVKEVTESTATVGVSGFLFNLHYLVLDRMGNVAVIEGGKGALRFNYIRGPEFAVLSNNLYTNSLRYLENFKGFGGDMPVINRSDSQSRFVTIANNLKYFQPDHPDHNYLFSLLDSVRQEDTKWSIVYDNLNVEVFFLNRLTGINIVLSLSDMKRLGESAMTYIDLMDDPPDMHDLQRLDMETNLELLGRVKECSEREDIADKSVVLKTEAIFREGNRLFESGKCKFPVKKEGCTSPWKIEGVCITDSKSRVIKK